MNFKVVIHPKKVTKEGKTNIKIRFTHKRDVRELATKFYIEPDCFDKKTCKVKKNHPNAAFINLELKKELLSYEEKIISVDMSSWSSAHVVKFLKKPVSTETDFYSYYNEIIELKSRKNKRTSEIYKRTYDKVQDFSPGHLSFEEIDINFLRNFEAHLINIGNDTNTRAIDFRNMRHIFNCALDDEIITHYPFRKFKIENKRESSTMPLSIEQIKAIRDFKTDKEHFQIARDVFMASFYLLGINISDLYELTKLRRDGRIYYDRNKTHKGYSIFAHREVLELMEKYKDPERLFNFYHTYTSRITFKNQINLHLKEIGKNLEDKNLREHKLIMYHARHSWATLASSIDIPKETISAALGHSNKNVTDIYIRYDFKKVDEANRKVLDLLINQ